MEKNELYIGLDIGTTKIVAMIGIINEYNKLKIIGVGKSKSLGVHRGVVNNISQTIQSIQGAIHEAENHESRYVGGKQRQPHRRITSGAVQTGMWVQSSGQGRADVGGQSFEIVVWRPARQHMAAGSEAQ